MTGKGCLKPWQKRNRVRPKRWSNPIIMRNILFVNVVFARFGKPNEDSKHTFLIATCYDNTVFSRFSAHHVNAFCLFETEGNAPNCGLCFFLNACFRFFSSIPMT